MAEVERLKDGADWRVDYRPQDVLERNTIQVVRADGSNVARGIMVAAYAEIMVQEHNRAVAAEREAATLKVALAGMGWRWPVEIAPGDSRPRDAVRAALAAATVLLGDGEKT